MIDPSRSRRPVLVSFSGIDGAGKSTQIENLHRLLIAAGFQVQRLAFWDDVAVLRRFRELDMVSVQKGRMVFLDNVAELEALATPLQDQTG